MVFSSNIFLFLFLPLTLLAYFILPEKLVGKKYKNYLLLTASLLFYSWGEAQYLALLIISILGNYFFGLLIAKDAKKIAITIAVTFNLLILAYFKYANFLVENLNELFSTFSAYHITLDKVHLPIGISFFTFHTISYLVDIYRRKCKPQKNVLDLALYIAFFPQLVAGPIVRYNFIAKYLTKRRHNPFLVSYGVRRFLIGFTKKIIIANPLGELADIIFASPASDISPTIAWIGIICYSLQIYFDFSGYSDMAIGLARIFGLRFPENFNYPYMSRSIQDFWRRWHMSLSAWFRDYVYIPLGGNRVSLSRQYFNLILVFFLCGLWHGASWNFIIWGLFHGAFLVFERLKMGKKFLTSISVPFAHLYVLLVVMIGWVFFRSPDLTHALSYLNIMFTPDESTVVSANIARLMKSHIVGTAFVLGVLGSCSFVKNGCLKLMRKNTIFIPIFDVVLMFAFLFAIIRISSATHNPFIYFQF